MIYRLRLAAKKVDDDRKYQESLLHPEEDLTTPLIKIPIIPLRKAEKQEEEQPRSIDEVLEQEIVNGAKKIEIALPEKKESSAPENKNEDWWSRDC